MESSAVPVNDPFSLFSSLDSLSLSDVAPTVASAIIEESNHYHNSNECQSCGGKMFNCNMKYICQSCGLVMEGDTADLDDDYTSRGESGSSNIRIVGPNSNQLQPDLYKSSTCNNSANQKKQIYEEFCLYRHLYMQNGGREFSLSICKLAAQHYNEVQKEYVKRSQNKKALMAACFYHACIKNGISPSRMEVAKFMQLPNKGIARGSNFVRSLVADGKMGIEPNIDTSSPEIITLFAHLGLSNSGFDKLRSVVYEIVQVAIKNNIGTNSFLRSKVAGATFVVLRRSPDKLLHRNIQDFCQDRIRKNTVERFTTELNNYHSYFEEIYKKAGLNSERW